MSSQLRPGHWELSAVEVIVQLPGWSLGWPPGPQQVRLNAAWLPGPVAREKGLVSRAACCTLWLSSVSVCGLATVPLYIRSVPGVLNRDPQRTDKGRRPGAEGGREEGVRPQAEDAGNHKKKLEEAERIVPRGLWTEHGPRDTLIFDFWPPETLKIHFCCFQPPSLWRCVKAAVGNERSYPQGYTDWHFCPSPVWGLLTILPRWRWAKVGREQQEGHRERQATRQTGLQSYPSVHSFRICSGPKMALMARGSKV